MAAHLASCAGRVFWMRAREAILPAPALASERPGKLKPPFCLGAFEQFKILPLVRKSVFTYEKQTRGGGGQSECWEAPH